MKRNHSFKKKTTKTKSDTVTHVLGAACGSDAFVFNGAAEDPTEEDFIGTPNGCCSFFFEENQRTMNKRSNLLGWVFWTHVLDCDNGRSTTTKTDPMTAQSFHGGCVQTRPEATKAKRSPQIPECPVVGNLVWFFLLPLVFHGWSFFQSKQKKKEMEQVVCPVWKKKKKMKIEPQRM